MLILTNRDNHVATVEFFEKNNYFGGNSNSFVFFEQRMLPAVNMEGKIYMKSRGEICLAPSGSGALLEAIRSSKAASEILNDVEFVHVVGVENALCKILDPIQIGFTQS